MNCQFKSKATELSTNNNADTNLWIPNICWVIVYSCKQPATRFWLVQKSSIYAYCSDHYSEISKMEYHGYDVQEISSEEASVTEIMWR